MNKDKWRVGKSGVVFKTRATEIKFLLCLNHLHSPFELRSIANSVASVYVHISKMGMSLSLSLVHSLV